MQTSHSLCITGQMDMREKDERATGKNTNVFTHFVRISIILFSVYVREHLFSFVAVNTVNIFLQQGWKV